MTVDQILDNQLAMAITDARCAAELLRGAAFWIEERNGFEEDGNRAAEIADRAENLARDLRKRRDRIAAGKESLPGDSSAVDARRSADER